MPLTVAGLKTNGIKRLKEAGIDDAEISARAILQHILKKSPSELQFITGDTVTDDVVQDFYELIERRCSHYPLQYLIGEVEFYNVKLKIDDRALIPRPETEILVENVLTHLKKINYPYVLDIGTGSGNIAAALAFNIDDIRITAVDISRDALELAYENAKHNNVSNKIEFICGDVLKDSFWNTNKKYDAIVSNPPYVTQEEIASLQEEVKTYEPNIALVSSKDPLKFFKTIIKNSKNMLKPDGIVCFEVGAGQALNVEEFFYIFYENISVKRIKDLSGIERVVIGVFTN